MEVRELDDSYALFIDVPGESLISFDATGDVQVSHVCLS